jgi:hypothetical protein
MFAMSGDGTDDVTIPVVFLFYQDASDLMDAMYNNPALEVTVTDLRAVQQQQQQQHETGSSLSLMPLDIATRQPGFDSCQEQCCSIHSICTGSGSSEPPVQGVLGVEEPARMVLLYLHSHIHLHGVLLD